MAESQESGGDPERENQFDLSRIQPTLGDADRAIRARHVYVEKLEKLGISLKSTYSDYQDGHKREGDYSKLHQLETYSVMENGLVVGEVRIRSRQNMGEERAVYEGTYKGQSFAGEADTDLNTSAPNYVAYGKVHEEIFKLLPQSLQTIEPSRN